MAANKTMTTITSVDRLEVLVLVDNVTDSALVKMALRQKPRKNENEDWLNWSPHNTRLPNSLRQLDALLAASARRCKVSVVTENWRDFKLIQRFCNVKVFKAAEFFSL